VIRSLIWTALGLLVVVIILIWLLSTSWSLNQIALGLLAGTIILIWLVQRQALIATLRLAGEAITFLFGLALLTLLVLALLHIDPMPYLRTFGLRLQQGRVVDFFALLGAQPKYVVTSVYNEDTDGDGQKEWLVFYQFDLTDGRSPYAGVVYDADRGDPPIIYPYRLLPLDRDYLSEGYRGDGGRVWYQLQDIDQPDEQVPGSNATPGVRELFVYGSRDGLTTDLTIFRHYANTEAHAFPSDSPPRYRPIGTFRGDGGVVFDPVSRVVTVTHRVYERSQLAVESAYAYNVALGRYTSQGDDRRMPEPVSKRVIFAFGMPADILDSPYPEKLLLGFYTVLGQPSGTPSPDLFLRNEALIMFGQRRWDYFGFPCSLNGSDWSLISNLQVTELSYAPQAEAYDPYAATPCPIPCVRPRQDATTALARVTFDAWINGQFYRTRAPVQFELSQVAGAWRIDRNPNPPPACNP